MWGPKGRQVMIPTPMQPTRRYGLGAVNWHTGETVVLTRQHKRRREIAEVLEALLAKHRAETVYVAWDNANTHEDAEVEAVLRGAAGRLILLYLPTYSPWLNPIEMLWRHFRREVTHCELFDNIEAMLEPRRRALHHRRTLHMISDDVLSGLSWKFVGRSARRWRGCRPRSWSTAMTPRKPRRSLPAQARHRIEAALSRCSPFTASDTGGRCSPSTSRPRGTCVRSLTGWDRP